MNILRAAVALGVSAPFVVLACGSDNSIKVAAEGDAGEAGESAGGNAGAGGSNGMAGRNEAGAGGATPTDGGAGGAPEVGAAPSAGAGGAGGEPEPSCGDAALTGGLVCFSEGAPRVVGEGTLTDVAIGAWDAADGLDVIVAGGGVAYLSNDGTGALANPAYLANGGVVLGVGQLDSGSELDLLLGQPNSGSSTIDFGDGAGAIAATETSGFGSEGVLFNYFVADLVGSGPSQDIVVTYGNSISVVPTTGTEGAGFYDISKVDAVYPAGLDAVLATLGSSQWLVYSTEARMYRHEVTFDAGTVALGTALETPVGGSPAQLDVADFNEDGFDDVAATLSASGNVSVLFGDGVGAGDFASVAGTDRFLTLSVGTSAAAKTQRDVKVGDFNGDDHADLAVSVSDLDAIAIFSGDGAGAFSGPQLVSTGEASGPTRLAVGDLNGDAIDDLAVIGGTSNRLIVLLSNP